MSVTRPLLRSPLRPLLRSPMEAGWGSRRGLLLIAAGQSNATRRAPKVSTSYPDKLVTFTGANEPVDRGDGLSVFFAMPGSYYADTQAFTEFSADSESLAPGFAHVDTRYRAIVTHTTALGGHHYREMMTGQGAWANLSMALRKGKELINAPKVEIVVMWDEGEADSDTTGPGSVAEGATITAAEWVEVLQDFATELYRTARLSVGSPTIEPTIIAYQPCIVGGDGYRAVQNGHVTAAAAVAGYNLAGPRYAYPYETDGVHITGEGKRLAGEYLAHRVEDVRNGSALPVYITSATRSGAVITANYNTISGDLVIDTTKVPETTTSFPSSKYGFEWFTGGVTQVAVSDVTVSGKVATITLASDPGASGELRYAQMTWPGGAQSVTTSTSKLARGNIRDGGARTALYDGSTLCNWACHQTVFVA